MAINTTLEQTSGAAACPFSEIFSPALFDGLVALFIPWPASDVPDPAAIRAYYYHPDSPLPGSIAALCGPKAFGLLLDLELTLASIPEQDLLQFLPAPGAQNFPQQALGFALLVDAAPRLSAPVPGIAPLARRLAGQLFALPCTVRPDARERWAGYTYDHTALARLWLYAPLTHSEDYSDQMLAEGLLEGLRRDTEAHYGVLDPTRRRDRAVAGDVGGLARLVKGGPPPCGGKEMHTLIYWSAMVARAHAPIVRACGRFPELNAVSEREDAEEEKNYLAGKKVEGAKYSACG